MKTVKTLLQNLDAITFAETQLQFTPDEIQRRVLDVHVKRGILNCCRQWGKSTLTSIKAVHHAISHDKSLIIVVSPTERQSAEFVHKAAEFVSRLGIRPRGDGKNSVSLLLPNGSRIVGLPGNERTVRGFSAVSLMLIDEASRVPDDLYKAVRPMLAVSDGSLWLMSTPFGQRGFFYETWTGAGPQWVRIKATGPACARISKEFLEEERRDSGERWFSQDYLCEFVSTEDLLFDVDAVRARISDDVEPLFPEGTLWR